MDKKVFRAKLTVLIIGMIYIIISVLAVFSSFNVNTNTDINNKANFVNIAKLAWLPFVFIILFIVNYILYNKKDEKKIKKGAMLGILIGSMIIINTVQNTIISGFNLLVCLISVILPMILIIQGIGIIKYKQNKYIKKEESLQK